MEDLRRKIHIVCEQFRTTHAIRFYPPTLYALVKDAVFIKLQISKEDLQTLQEIFTITCDVKELEEMQHVITSLQSNTEIDTEHYFKTISTIQDKNLKDLCKDMIEGFSIMRAMKTAKFGRWKIHSEIPIGVESQFAKVYSVCYYHEKEPCFYIVKAAVCNGFFTLADAVNEIQMQYECNQLGLAPAIVDAFVSSSCVGSKSKDKVVFMVMQKKGFTVKEIFTKLLPLQWWSMEGELSLNRDKLVGVVYHAGLTLLAKANKHGYFHMDPHLGNFMFDMPVATRKLLQGIVCEPKKYKEAFQSFCRGGHDALFTSLGLDSLQLIDFGMSNRKGPEAIDKYKGSFSKLLTLKPKRNNKKDCEEYV